MNVGPYLKRRNQTGIHLARDWVALKDFGLGLAICTNIVRDITAWAKDDLNGVAESCS